jgi:hypothetical protein
VNVLTNRYDAARTGANLSETKLTVANVNVSQFGKLYSYPVDGSVYAQPLYVSGVLINGTPRNVLYVATMNDKVYAFDADSSSAAPLWMRDFTNPPSVTPVPIADIVGPNFNVVGNVGIQSTPVIDAASGTIYLVARTKENGSYFQRLHALDITTGASRPGSPVTITGSVVGSAPDSIGQVVTFNPKMQSQRAGLAISNGVVLISWAAHEDALPYHGWIMGYDTASLARVAIYCVTPDVYAGGIWQGGRAPTIDAAGHAYFATGNGRWDGSRSFGNSLLKFSVSRTGGLSLVDYFTPGNHAQLDADDDDLSGSGFTLLPGTNLLLGGGKEGVLYLLNGDSLGRMVANDTQIVQKIPVMGGHVMGGIVYWHSANLGPIVYNWSEDDALKSYRLSNGRLALPPHAQGLPISPGHPGGSLTLSANGGAASSGIVWSSMPATEDAIHGLHAGVLRAFNAETLSEIWSSERNAARDRAGTLMKFVPPVVANGKVFLPNHDNAVVVYGLLPDAPPPPPAAAGTISVSFAGNHPTAMTAGETAGVVTASNWNNAFGGSGSIALRNASGAATSVSVTWSGAGGTWMLPIADQPGNARMMKGYLDTGSFSTTRVSVTGLAQASYDVYVYADGDNKVYERSAAYTISGPGVPTTTVTLTDAANTNFGGTFTRAANSAGNYVRFSIAATGFTIDATPTAPESGTRRAPINGIQIVPTSPPPPPDFSLHTHPHSRAVVQGATTTYDVSATAWNGFSGTIALSVSGAPAGTTTTFNPASINGAGSSTLTVTTSASTPAGTSALTITGRSGTLTHSESVALTVEAAAPPPSGSGTISIDFVGDNPASMGSSETAGVVAKANWNSAFGAASSAPLRVRDEAGAATNVTVTWSSPGGTWMLPIADQPGSVRMMKGYLDTTNSSTTTVQVAGLAAGTYDIYVYADGDNKVYERAAAYTISGSGITTTTIDLIDAANTNFASTFTRAENSHGNYVRFSITVSGGGGFTLEAAPTTPVGGTLRAPINAIQIVPTSAPPPPPPAMGAIGIDFVGSSGIAMAAGESAGVVPQANWNSAAGGSQTSPLTLVDASGAATSATVSWSANGGWAIPITDQPGDRRLMRGYLDTSSTSVTTVTVAGLPSGTYDVYVYADGDNRGYTRTAAYRISGSGVTDTTINLTDPAYTDFSGSFTQAAGTAGNYVKFTITAGGFTLTATPVSGTNTTLRAPINALQIVPR